MDSVNFIVVPGKLNAQSAACPGPSGGLEGHTAVSCGLHSPLLLFSLHFTLRSVCALFPSHIFYTLGNLLKSLLERSGGTSEKKPSKTTQVEGSIFLQFSIFPWVDYSQSWIFLFVFLPLYRSVTSLPPNPYIIATWNIEWWQRELGEEGREWEWYSSANAGVRSWDCSEAERYLAHTLGGAHSPGHARATWARVG